MKWIATLALLAWIATPVLAGDDHGHSHDEKDKDAKTSCDAEAKSDCEKSSDCETACESACDAGSATVSQRIAKLEKGAAKGCKSSAKMLTTLQAQAKVDSVSALKEKVAACEKYAGMGCSVSKKMLETMNASMPKAKVKPVRLSLQVARLAAKDCKKSASLMSAMMKQHGAADAGALVALVGEWETKAANGCTKCVAKLATVRSAIPSARPVVRTRLMSIASGCEKGCAKAEGRMAKLAKDHGAKDRSELMTLVSTWEAKAESGCTKCVAKLTKLDSDLAAIPMAAKLSSAKADAASAASDCEKDCGTECGADGDADCAKDCGSKKDCTSKNPGS